MKIVQKDLIVPQNMVFPVSFVSSKKIDLAKRNSQKPTQTKKNLLLISQNNTTKKKKGQMS